MARHRNRKSKRTSPHDDVAALSYAPRVQRIDEPRPPIVPPEPLFTRGFLLCALLLWAAAVVAFHPTLSSDFVTWDDPDYVTKNVLLRDADGLKHIWNPRSDKNQQFYPLVFTSYWLEYHLAEWAAAGDTGFSGAVRALLGLDGVAATQAAATQAATAPVRRLSTGDPWTPGLDPGIYHRTNLVLHLVNIVLVLALLRRFGAPMWAAAVAAGLFAVHPAQVASVLWVAERKNTLSGLFYLIAFLLYLWHRRARGWGSWCAYAACLLAFVAALLSKTQTLTLPISLLFIDWALQSAHRIRRARWYGLILRLGLMLAVGMAFAFITMSVERSKGPSKNPEKLISTAEQRPFIAANAAWFYAGTFLAPVHLAIVYPKWDVSLEHPIWWAGLLAWPVAIGLACRHWRRIGGLTLWGMAHFFVILAPALGLIPFNYQQYSYVADHFLYLAVIGGGLAVALTAHRLIDARPAASPRRAVAAVVALLVLAACVWTSHGESRHWRDTETFWTRAIARNDACFPAFYNLGNYYTRQRPPQWDKAVDLYRRASEIQPNNRTAFQRYVDGLISLRRDDELIAACTKKIEQIPGHYRAYLNRARAYVRKRQYTEAVADYQQVIRLAPPNSSEHAQARSELERLQSMMQQQQPAPDQAEPDNRGSAAPPARVESMARGDLSVQMSDLRFAMWDMRFEI